MEEIIKQYFRCWLDKNSKPLNTLFSDDIIYTECYGPQYHGLNQLEKWFDDWNQRASVLKWDIKQIIIAQNQAVVEWYFECVYDGKKDGFDGVSIMKFQADMKICELKEFQSKSEHIYPYDEK